MLEEVKGFKTSDGQVHLDKIKALEHEQKIELRGIFQSANRNLGGNGTLTTTDAATIVLTNADAIMGVVDTYKRLISQAKGQIQRQATIRANKGLTTQS